MYKQITKKHQKCNKGIEINKQKMTQFKSKNENRTCSGHEQVSNNTYIYTSWSRVLLEKLIGFQLVKNFSALYGNRRFITPVTSARHLSLS
jgi:hypothetical protein